MSCGNSSEPTTPRLSRKIEQFPGVGVSSRHAPAPQDSPAELAASAGGFAAVTAEPQAVRRRCMIEIRPAIESDARGLLEILRWLPIQSRIIKRSPDGDAQLDVTRLQDLRWCTLVAVTRESREVVGAAVGYDSRYFEGQAGGPPVAKLEDLVVDSDHERRGIGGSLVHAFEEWARGRGCVRSEISGGPKPGFYERCGYQRQGPFFHFVKDLGVGRKDRGHG